MRFRSHYVAGFASFTFCHFLSLLFQIDSREETAGLFRFVLSFFLFLRFSFGFKQFCDFFLNPI